MAVKFEVDASATTKLEEYFKQLPGRAENVTNNYLHTQGADIAATHITDILPVSRSGMSARAKIHAKNSRPFQTDTFNLGFSIRAKRKFGYLYFPNEGLGTSLGHEPQQFMERGLEQATPIIIDGLTGQIENIL